MKRVYLPLMFLVLLAFASTASACERCRLFNGNTTCWSGATHGYQWCYGGWGEPCQVGGSCYEPLAAPPALAPPEQVCANAVLGCDAGVADLAPAGFTLDKPAEVKRPEVKAAS